MSKKRKISFVDNEIERLRDTFKDWAKLKGRIVPERNKEQMEDYDIFCERMHKEIHLLWSKCYDVNDKFSRWCTGILDEADIEKKKKAADTDGDIDHQIEKVEGQFKEWYRLVERSASLEKDKVDQSMTRFDFEVWMSNIMGTSWGKCYDIIYGFQRHLRWCITGQVVTEPYFW